MTAREIFPKCSLATSLSTPVTFLYFKSLLCILHCVEGLLIMKLVWSESHTHIIILDLVRHHFGQLFLESILENASSPGLHILLKLNSELWQRFYAEYAWGYDQMIHLLLKVKEAQPAKGLSQEQRNLAMCLPSSPPHTPRPALCFICCTKGQSASEVDSCLNVCQKTSHSSGICFLLFGDW